MPRQVHGRSEGTRLFWVSFCDCVSCGLLWYEIFRLFLMGLTAWFQLQFDDSFRISLLTYVSPSTTAICEKNNYYDWIVTPMIHIIVSARNAEVLVLPGSQCGGFRQKRGRGKGGRKRRKERKRKIPLLRFHQSTVIITAVEDVAMSSLPP